MLRYTITAIKKDGRRQLAFDNNGTNTYKTEELAQHILEAVLKNNSKETIEHVGRELQVRPVECYGSGDSKQNLAHVILQF
jgi:phosphoserine phosphatase